jgi:hypothetical protein
VRDRRRGLAEDDAALRTPRGLGHFPPRDYGLDKAWLDAAMIACILLSWPKFPALDGELARAEPKTPRYRVLHAP